MSKRTSICSIILGIVVVGCGDGERKRDVNLLRENAQEPPIQSAELQRKHAMQAITVRGEQIPYPFDIESGDLIGTIQQECWASSYGTPANYPCRTPQPSSEACIGAHKHDFCVGAALLDIAKGNEAVFPTIWDTSQGCLYPELPPPPRATGYGPYRVLPLSPAQKVDVLAAAHNLYRGLIWDLASDINSPGCRDSNLDSTPEATGIVEAYRALEEVTNILVEAELAVADKELASTPDMALAVQRAMSSPLLSHASAATWLVGGYAEPTADRLLTFPGAGDGFCTLPRLSPQAEVALSAFREAAPPPSAILAIPSNPLAPTASEISTNDLINKRALTLDSQPVGSVIERLEHKWNTIITDTDIALRLGVDHNAFANAREYLAQEIKAFARPLDQYSGPAEPLQFRRYTATATPPAPRSSAYYAAIARSAPTWYGAGGWYYGHPDDPTRCLPGTPFLFASRGYGLDRIRDDMMTLISCIEGQEGAEHVAPFAAVRTQIERERRETIVHRVTFSNATPDKQYISIVSGAQPSRGYRVVRGADAMECLSLNNIDGVNCGASAGLGQPGGAWNVCDLATIDGNTECAFDPPIESDVTYYVLRSTEAANWVDGHWDTAPSRWEPVTGFQLFGLDTKAPPTGGNYYRTIPVYSDIEQRVARMMRPSRSWCTKTEHNCLGLSDDDPIPLENSLSGDGDNVESTWKYYLGLAKDAAAKADDLASQYFDSVLSVDQLKVAEDRYIINKQEETVARLEELQRICGTSVAATDLLKALGDLSDDFEMNSLYHGACDGSERQPTSVYDCVGSSGNERRVLSIAKLISMRPDLAALKMCVDDLSDSTDTINLVHLGDADLCVPDAAINNTCGGANDPCPGTQVAVVVPGSSTPQCAAGFTIVPKQDGLAFFKTMGNVSQNDGEEVCDAFRKARSSYTSPKLDEKLESPMLNGENMYEVGKLLKMELQVGGYVTIRGPSGILFTTGSSVAGPATSGPGCSTSLPPACSDAASALTCRAIDCTDPVQRHEMNQRLMEAYVAAKLVTWKDGDGPISVTVPSYILYGAVPNDQTSTDVIQFKRSTDSFPLRRVTSRHWQLFTDAGASAGTPMWTGSIAVGKKQDGSINTVSWPLQASSDDLGIAQFALQTRDIQPQHYQDVWRKFWGGLGGTTTADGGTNGCLAYDLTHNGSSCASISTVLAGSGERAKLFEFNQSFNVFVDDLSLFARAPFEDCTGGDWGNRFCLADPGSVSSNLAAALARSQGQYDGYYYPVSIAPDIRVHYGTTSQVTHADPYWDGAELLCEAAVQAAGGTLDCGSVPPPLRTVDDLSQTGEYLQCLGRQISLKGATAVFKGIPKQVLDPLRSNTGAVYSSASGEIGQALDELKVALLQTYRAQQTIGHIVRQFGSEMKSLQAMMRQYADLSKINDVQFEATQLRETTSCIASVSSLAGLNSVYNPGSVGAAAANCANAIGQIKFADKIRDLQKEGFAAETEVAIAHFDQSFDEKAQILDAQSTDLSEALYRVNQLIGRVADLRSQAARVMTDATWLLSNDSKSTAFVRIGTESRKAIVASRYKTAMDNARRLAFLAKRAIEQRLGLHLDSMVDDLPLVEAPARWESTICFNIDPGVQFDWLSHRHSPTNEGASDVVPHAYIGDYITKLENLVESYRLVNGFQDGHDTAVVSLRDDILNARQYCARQSRNLLVSTDNLSPKKYGPLAAGEGWFIAECDETLVGNVPGAAPPNCVNITQEGSTRPGGAAADVPTYRMAFGGGTDAADPCANVAQGTCGYLPNSRLAQTVHLPPGSYAVSWYQQKNNDTDESLIEVHLPTIPGLEVVQPSSTIATSGGWAKRAAVFTLSEKSDVMIGFRKGASNSAGSAGANPAIWAAPMLESLSARQMATNPWTDMSIGKYEMTDAAGLTRQLSCEDSDGIAFRKMWTSGCVNLCPDGYSTNCSGFAEEACYREIAFPMTQWGIESSQQFVQSGFARGNFNYRIHRLGLNFVGTGLRSCAASTLPQTCYSGGFVTYSLGHEGPYAVRNHLGVDYLASLFEGNIEHARGLGSERYVTNPIGGTDKSLLEDYMRQEMSGRPLSGTFVLRVWDDPNLNFEAIEDVQIILDYGYWTRLSK